MAEKAINRENLVRELLELRHKYAPYEPRDKEIRALLIQSADQDGESFKIVDKLGKASVSAPHPKELIATAPEVVVEKFLALPKAEQNVLLKRGVIRIAEQWKAAYSGRVTVDLFP
jgi:hypothetical protein